MNTLKEYNLSDKKHRLIRISSEDKKSGQTNSRFSVSLPTSGGAIDRICGFRLKYASVPNIFNNVASYNNTLTIIKDDLTEFIVNVDPNQYNLTDFINELQTKINAQITPDTCTITNTTGNKLNFTFTGNNYQLNYDKSTINDIIGLGENTPFFLTLTLNNPINLIGETEIYIHSRTLHQSGLTEKDGNFSIVDIIPLNVPYGGVAYITYPDKELAQINYEPYENNKSFRNVDIVLRNRKGDVVELPDNFYFTMTLKIYHD